MQRAELLGLLLLFGHWICRTTLPRLPGSALEAHGANGDRLLRSLNATDRRALDALLRTLLADVESN
jgi:hypothetical protein